MTFPLSYDLSDCTSGSDQKEAFVAPHNPNNHVTSAIRLAEAAQANQRLPAPDARQLAYCAAAAQ
jgi:hypothetical protein